MAGQANGGQVVPPRGVSGGQMAPKNSMYSPSRPRRGVLSDTGMVNPQYNLHNQQQGGYPIPTNQRTDMGGFTGLPGS